MGQPQLTVERPVEVVLEQVEGFVGLILQHRLGKQPVDLRAVADPATGQVALRGAVVEDLRQWQVVVGLDRLQCAKGPVQIGRQQAIELADHDQGHVVRRVPVLAYRLQLFAGQVLDPCPSGTFEAQFHGQLIAAAVPALLNIQPALQVRVVTAVLALDHLLGGGDIGVAEAGPGQDGQQQVEDLALVVGRCLDHEGGIGVAGVGVPLATEGLHAFLQAALAAAVDAAEQQVFEQVRQFLVGAGEIVEADAHHQADRHMPAFAAGLEQQLQAVGQLITLDLEAIKGMGGGKAEQQAHEQQATHNHFPRTGSYAQTTVKPWTFKASG